MGCFGWAGNVLRRVGVASEIAVHQLGLGCWLEELVDAVKDCVCLSHGVAKPLEVLLEVVEGFVVA